MSIMTRPALRRPARHVRGTRRADLDIGVIYTHEREFMARLLPSLRASAAGHRTRLILVDNASDDGAAQWQPAFPKRRVVRNAQRLWYSANLNRIVRASTARYVLLLNTDMYFEPQEQCLGKMVRFMDAHPRCGMAGCRLLHADGGHAPSARRFQTIATILARRCGLASLLRGTIDRYLYAEHEPQDTFRCDWLSGCFLLLRREALREVGFFDEGFVKYFEEVDYCLRMARQGWDVMYHGATYCYHLEQRDSRRVFSSDARQHLLSYARFLRKWGWAPARAAEFHAARREMSSPAAVRRAA